MSFQELAKQVLVVSSDNSLIFSKASWRCSFHTIRTSFLSSRNIGSHVIVSWAMNLLMYCILLRNPRISLSVLEGFISTITLILSRSTSIPLWLTINPNSFPDVTPKVHFFGFNHNLQNWILSKNFLKASMCPSRSLDFTIISSI